MGYCLQIFPLFHVLRWLFNHACWFQLYCIYAWRTSMKGHQYPNDAQSHIETLCMNGWKEPPYNNQQHLRLQRQFHGWCPCVLRSALYLRPINSLGQGRTRVRSPSDCQAQTSSFETASTGLINWFLLLLVLGIYLEHEGSTLISELQDIEYDLRWDSLEDDKW